MIGNNINKTIADIASGRPENVRSDATIILSNIQLAIIKRATYML